MYDKSLVLDILEQIIDAVEVIYGICKNHLKPLLKTLQQIKLDLHVN